MRTLMLILSFTTLNAFAQGEGAARDSEFIQRQRAIRSTPCGVGQSVHTDSYTSMAYSSTADTCWILQPQNEKNAKNNPVYKALKESQNSDVSLDVYRAIERDFHARGEPLNAASLASFLALLAKKPNTTCEFDQLRASSYGLKCNDGEKSWEFPGLTEKFLRDKFAKYETNPPESTIVAETEEEEQPVADNSSNDEDLTTPTTEVGSSDTTPTTVEIPIVEELVPAAVVYTGMPIGEIADDLRPAAAVK